MKPALQCGARCSGNCEYNCGNVEAAYDAGFEDGAKPSTKRPLYVVIANTLLAHENCRKSGNAEWQKRWADWLKKLDEMLPSGSGFDAGSVVLKDESSERELNIQTSFHHLTEDGGYDCWTEHRVIVKADLVGLRVEVTGHDYRDINDFIGDVFHQALTTEVEPFTDDMKRAHKAAQV